MSDNGLQIERVWDLMAVKGFTDEDLIKLGFKKSRIRGWRYTTRRPEVDDVFKIADWLEAPPQYFYGREPHLEGLPAWKVASRTSLEFFLKNTRDVPPDGRTILEH